MIFTLSLYQFWKNNLTNLNSPLEENERQKKISNYLLLIYVSSSSLDA